MPPASSHKEGFLALIPWPLPLRVSVTLAKESHEGLGGGGRGTTVL